MQKENSIPFADQDPKPSSPVVAANRRSRGRTPNLDRGLPSDEALISLAKTYLTTQIRLWPDLANDGTLPLPSDETFKSMVASFRESFLTEQLSIFRLAASKHPWVALAASYVRYSDANSNPRSLNQQLELQLERARGNNHFVPWLYVFADAAVTGRTAARHGYILFKAALDLEDVKVLYVDELGRASRDAVESLRLGRLFDGPTKRLIGVSDGFDSATPSSKLHLGVLAMISEQFCDQLKSKVNRGMNDAFTRGTNVGPPPVGYTLVPAADEHGRSLLGKDGVRLKTKVVDPETAKHVLEAFEDFGLKNRSPGEIARHFNELSLADKRSWDDSMVRQMLRRETYVGIEIYGRTHQVRDPDTGKIKTFKRKKSEWKIRRDRSIQIVPWPLWKLVRKRLEACKTANGKDLKKDSKTRSDLYPNVLIRPVCGSCGANLSLGRAKEPYGSFFCGNGASGKKGCQFRGYKAVKIVNRAILAVIRQKIFTPAFLDRVLESANGFLAEAAARPRESSAHLEARIQKLSGKCSRLGESIADEENKDQSRVLARTLRTYEGELKELREELKHLNARNEPTPPNLTAEDVQTLLKHCEVLLEQDTAVAATVLKTLTGAVVVNEVAEASRTKPTWIASFSLNAVPVLVELAASRNHPTRPTWEYLNRASWTISESIAVKVEADLRRHAHVDSVAELIGEGSSISQAAATLGISWQVAKEALNHARLNTDSAISKRLFSPGLDSEEAAHRPTHTTEVWHLYEHESLSFPKITERLQLSQSTIQRAYNWVRDEKMVALKCGTPLPDYMRLPADAQAKPVSVLKADALRAYVGIIPILREHRDAGLSMSSIAQRLNDEGHSTRRGKRWTSSQVGKVLKLHKD